MTVLYFTATGNSLYVAKQIGGNLVSMPKSVKDGRFRLCDDKIGMVFPIFNLSIPQYIKEFINKAKLESDYVFAVMSYGNFSGGAAGRLFKIASERGIHFSYINTILMTDNWLPMFFMEKQLA